MCLYSFLKGIFEMKKIALATLLVLCGARVYGIDPVEQPKVVVTQEDVRNVQKFLNDTKSIDAMADQLGLPKEEIKGWFSRHKVITSTVVGAYAVALVLSYLTKEIRWNEKTGKIQGYSVDCWADTTLDATKFQKLSHYLHHYLRYAQAPLWAAKYLAIAGRDQITEHYYRSAIIGLLALFAIYEIYQGKDSAFAHGWNWAFGKNAAEDAQLVAEAIAAEEVAAQAKVEEVTPVVTQVVEAPVVTPEPVKVEEVVAPVVVAPVENKVEEAVAPVVESPVVTPIAEAPVENKVTEVTPVVTPVENKVTEVTPVVTPVENKVTEVTPVVTPVENKIEEVVPAVAAAA
jgi:hypothetical protein